LREDHHSKENYLKAIAEAEWRERPLSAATLTRWLRVSAPAVTMAINGSSGIA